MRTLLALLATLLLATPAFAERDFRIGTERFSEAEILDARGLPSMGGEPVILVTLAQKAWPRLQKLTTEFLGKPLPVTVDGRTLATPLVRDAIADGVFEISGLASLPESETLAKLISGKPPLPDSLEE